MIERIAGPPVRAQPEHCLRDGLSKLSYLATSRITLLVPQFPVALRLRVKAKAVAEGRYLHEVFAEIVEKGLAAAEEKASRRREGKRHG